MPKLWIKIYLSVDKPYDTTLNLNKYYVHVLPHKFHYFVNKFTQNINTDLNM
jgi:hypothetical protein